MKKIIIRSILFIALMVSFITPAFATALQNERFVAGDNVNFKNDAVGSIALAGNKVTSTGNTDGIGFIAGNVVNVKGKYEYLVIAGNVIDVVANVEKEVYIAGSDISLKEGTTVARDTFIVGSTVNLTGTYNGNVYVSASKVNISNATISGNVKIASKSIVLGENVTISGNLKYPKDSTFKNEESSNIFKVTTYETDKLDNIGKTTFTDILSTTLYSFVCKAVIAIVISILIPFIYKRVKKSSGSVSFDNCASLFGKGFLYTILIPFISIFLLISVIGMPLGVIVLCLYGISIYVASIFSVYFITDYILENKFKKKLSAYLVAVIGLLCYYIIKLIPVVGTIVGILVFFIGFGILMNSLLKVQK